MTEPESAANISPMAEFPSETSADVEELEFPMDSTIPLTVEESTMKEQGHRSTHSLPFFADATLDLSEAHDIADTPEPRKSLVDVDEEGAATGGLPISMPTLGGPSNTETSNWNTKISQRNTENPSSPQQPMTRITSSDVQRRPPRHTHRPRFPRRPRDLSWAVSFLLVVPPSLVYCASLAPADNADLTAPPCVFYSILLCYGASLLLSRLLYRSLGGGDGDNARHTASQVLLAACPLSLVVWPLLLLVLYWKTPTVFFKYAWIFLGVGAAEVYWAVKHLRSRQLFFAALAGMVLDILSRSLRRMSFARTVGALMGLQLLVVVGWKLAVLHAWNSGRYVPLVVALLAGKWASGTVTRLLGHLASGGVASWFAQQTALMQEMERLKATQQQGGDATSTTSTDDASADYNVAGYSMTAMIPEEYRSAAASAYQSVLDMDEGMDDDLFDDDDEENNVERRQEWSAGGGGGAGGSTVRAFLLAACTISFGSVAQCGLVGGVAQFVWRVVRNVDYSSSSGFRGMPIGTSGGGLDGGRTSLGWKLVRYASVTARSFVRSHSDLAMSHVAAYYKGYQRAAIDVSLLVEASGVEPIIHDDISTHVCACLCSSISGLIVMFTGIVLSHHRSEFTTDETIVQSMIFAFLFCYTLLFTLMEPLRAGIKASYVCFAEHPQSLSQAFPLIFHRLSRISEANQP